MGLFSLLKSFALMLFVFSLANSAPAVKLPGQDLDTKITFVTREQILNTSLCQSTMTKRIYKCDPSVQNTQLDKFTYLVGKFPPTLAELLLDELTNPDLCTYVNPETRIVADYCTSAVAEICNANTYCDKVFYPKTKMEEVSLGAMVKQIVSVADAQTKNYNGLLRKLADLKARSEEMSYWDIADWVMDSLDVIVSIYAALVSFLFMRKQRSTATEPPVSPLSIAAGQASASLSVTRSHVVSPTARSESSGYKATDRENKTRERDYDRNYLDYYDSDSHSSQRDHSR